MVVRRHRTIERNPRILRVPLQGSQVVASMEVNVPAIVSCVLDLLGTRREWAEARLHGWASDLGTDSLFNQNRIKPAWPANYSTGGQGYGVCVDPRPMRLPPSHPET
jgi:hypothetical protein